MPVLPQIFESDNVTPATDLTFTGSAGDTSATVTKHIWNKGDTPLLGARLRVLAFNGTQWVTAGSPLVDELWTEVEVTGVIKTGDPTMPDYTRGTTNIGAGSDLPLPDLPANTAVKITARVRVPGSAPSGNHTLRFRLIYDEASMPLSSKVATATGSGVLQGNLDQGRRRVARARNVIADGATAVVIVERGSYDYDGTRKTRVRDSITLNQSDSVPSALTVGQSYIAVISQPATGAPIATKGVRAASPVAPATPTDHIFLGYVTVTYQGGGTSIITQANVNLTSVVTGDYRVTAGTGLAVKISAGDGLTSTDHYQYTESNTTLALTPSSTSYIWRVAAGTFSATVTSTRPSSGADLLAVVVTDATLVTSVTDRRTIVTPAILEHVLTLGYRDVLSVVTVPLLAIDYEVLPFAAELDSVTLDLTDTVASWTAGSVKIDIRYFAAGAAVPYPEGGAGVGGATIYTSNATDDRRPLIAYNATTKLVEYQDHEVRTFPKGTRFVMDIVGVPSAPAAEAERELIVQLHFRRSAA